MIDSAAIASSVRIVGSISSISPARARAEGVDGADPLGRDHLVVVVRVGVALGRGGREEPRVEAAGRRRRA